MYDLNEYRKTGDTQKFELKRFKWAYQGKVARCQQPHYGCHDSDHEIDKKTIAFLSGSKVRCIISANAKNLSEDSKLALKKAGIEYFNFKIPDMHAPSVEALRSAAALMQKAIDDRKGAALVYCGFGQGRTGTFIAAWAMIYHFPKYPDFDADARCYKPFLDEYFGVEKREQARAVRLAAGLPVTPDTDAPFGGLAPATGVFGTMPPAMPSGIPLPGSGSFAPGGSNPFKSGSNPFKNNSAWNSAFSAGNKFSGKMTSGAPKFANFGSADSLTLTPPPPMNPVEPDDMNVGAGSVTSKISSLF